MSRPASEQNQPPNPEEKRKAPRKNGKASSANGTNGAARKPTPLDRAHLLGSDSPFDMNDDDLSSYKPDPDGELSDLDLTERFDLGDSGVSRPHGRAAGIVDALDEIADTLSLSDDELPEDTPAPSPRAKRTAASRRNGSADPAGEEIVVEMQSVEVEVSLDLEAEDPVEDGEPDETALAQAAEVEVVEVVQPEELEKDIDRALNMEGVSVDDPVRIYLREIGRTPLLKSHDEYALAEKMLIGQQAISQLETRGIMVAKLDGSVPEDEEVRQLIAQYREGKRAKDVLVQANLRLVVSIARRYIGRGLSLLDLIQEGNIGLMKAADKFDYTKGFKFSTYATWWIRQAITRAISDQSRTIRLPVHVTEMVTRLRRAAHELQQELLREPTEEELGKKLDISAEKVRKILDMARHPASLDAPMEEGEDNFLGDFIEDERAATPMEEASRQMLKEQVDDILGKLTERERQILQMRYGLSDDRPRTLEEVAKAFGITRERIRQIETRILRKLRYARYGASKLRGYLD